MSKTQHIQITKLTFASFWQRAIARAIDIIITGTLSLVISTTTLALIAISQPEIYENQQLLNQGILQEKMKDSTDFVQFLSFVATSTENCSFEDQKYEDACKKIKNFQPVVIVVSSIISVIVTILYFVLLTASKLQSTLGKMLFRLKVVDARMGRISLVQAFAREIFGFLNTLLSVVSSFYPVFLPLAAGIEYTALFENMVMVFNVKSQTIHDKIAQTFVVKTLSEQQEIKTVLEVDKNS